MCSSLAPNKAWWEPKAYTGRVQCVKSFVYRVSSWKSGAISSRYYEGTFLQPEYWTANCWNASILVAKGIRHCCLNPVWINTDWNLLLAHAEFIQIAVAMNNGHPGHTAEHFVQHLFELRMYAEHNAKTCILIFRFYGIQLFIFCIFVLTEAHFEHQF